MHRENPQQEDLIQLGNALKDDPITTLKEVTNVLFESGYLEEDIRKSIDNIIIEFNVNKTKELVDEVENNIAIHRNGLFKIFEQLGNNSNSPEEFREQIDQLVDAGVLEKKTYPDGQIGVRLVNIQTH